mmetsp:Transcript_34649/g.62406  ORF Transcript_34649/g.62406 Transcript_34649/m.62406 type:complete len:399 (-) Transcript_34649:723-1919(-)
MAVVAGRMIRLGVGDDRTVDGILDNPLVADPDTPFPVGVVALLLLLAAARGVDGVVNEKGLLVLMLLWTGGGVEALAEAMGAFELLLLLLLLLLLPLLALLLFPAPILIPVPVPIPVPLPPPPPPAAFVDTTERTLDPDRRDADTERGVVRSVPVGVTADDGRDRFTDDSLEASVAVDGLRVAVVPDALDPLALSSSDPVSGVPSSLSLRAVLPEKLARTELTDAARLKRSVRAWDTFRSLSNKDILSLRRWFSPDKYFTSSRWRVPGTVHSSFTPARTSKTATRFATAEARMSSSRARLTSRSSSWLACWVALYSPVTRLSCSRSPVRVTLVASCSFTDFMISESRPRTTCCKERISLFASSSCFAKSRHLFSSSKQRFARNSASSNFFKSLLISFS